MHIRLCGVVISTVLAVAAVEARQSSTADKPDKAPTTITLTGCVSDAPGASGQYTFLESDGIREFRLNGRGISRYAGQRVEVVGGSGGKGLAIRGGLWPAPSGGARGVARDPAQEAIARQPGGGGAGARTTDFPEFKVTRVRVLDGACK
jgi:hypothetical protein